jgi:hypothetical protein
MANVRNLRREASSLLRVAKRAFKFVRQHAAGDDTERQSLLKELQEVIDRADPPSFDDSLSSVTLVMTNPTADALLKILEERAGKSDEDRDLFGAVTQGVRRTAQRVYVRLDVNHVVLRQLHYVLLHTGPKPQKDAFKRLAIDVEKDGLRKNPMEILGRMGL